MNNRTLFVVFLLFHCCNEPVVRIQNVEHLPAPYIIDTIFIDTLTGEPIIENFSVSEDYVGYLKSGRTKKTAPHPLSNKCPEIPATMADLSSGLKKYFYKVTEKDHLDLSIFGYGGIPLGKKEILLIVDFIQYKEVQCNDKTRTFGVGARLFLHLKEIRRGVNIMKLPQLAAHAELGRATVTCTVSTIGITGEKVLAVLPAIAEFNVENYARVIRSIDEIIRLARDNTPGVVIEPQLLPEVKEVARQGD